MYLCGLTLAAAAALMSAAAAAFGGGSGGGGGPDNVGILTMNRHGYSQWRQTKNYGPTNDRR